jgi:uncharacterized protein (DUF3084 family)
MDLSVLLFLVLIVVFGGLIAIWADNFGRKLGKKRLTLAGLRPRHTAMLVTGLLGSGISLVTILLVFAFSRDVRDWIVQGRAAIRKSQQLASANAQLEGNLESMRGEVKSLDDQRQRLNTTVAQENGKLLEIQGRLADSEARLKAARARETKARESLTLATSRLKETSTKLAAAGLEVALVQNKLNTLNSQYTYLYKDYSDQQKRDLDLTSRNAKLKTTNDELAANLRQLTENAAKLRKDLEADEAAKSEAERAVATAKSELEASRTSLSEVRAQVQQEELALQGLARVNEAARTQPMTFAQGDELARVPLRANASRRDVENALTRLMREAKVSAGRRGAGPRRSTGDTAGFVTRTVSGATVSPEDQEEAIVRRLVGEPHDVVLIAEALLNSFKGEFVALDVRGFNNPLVYKRRQVIASRQINGRLPRERLLAQLDDFLRNGVVRSALGAGMIPVEGSQGLLDVRPETTLRLVEQLAASGRTMRIQALVSSDTRAADPLNLDFVLK